MSIIEQLLTIEQTRSRGYLTMSPDAKRISLDFLMMSGDILQCTVDITSVDFKEVRRLTNREALQRDFPMHVMEWNAERCHNRIASPKTYLGFLDWYADHIANPNVLPFTEQQFDEVMRNGPG